MERTVKKMTGNIPYIHLFQTSESGYLYDVNTNRIKRLSPSVYAELDEALRTQCVPETVSTEWAELAAEGYLKTDRVEQVEHPQTPYLPFLLENKLKHLILQVTQRCNLRCEYCVYSGAYHNRTHANRDMSWEVAQQAIDYFIAHSRDTNPIMISFYGGEPLLNNELMAACMEYVKDHVKGKAVKYSITTNGTLLTPETLEFLVANKVSLTISLDGPQHVHDRYRKFANSSKGSFEVLKKNFRYMKEKYPEYAQKVLFNSVMDPSLGYSEIREFMNHDADFADYKFQSGTIDPNYNDVERNVCSEYLADSEYEYFLLLLQKLGKISSSFSAKNAAARYIAMLDRQIKSDPTDSIGQINHHGGPCVPGATRMFVNVFGKIFPCEKVSELSELALLGDISTGIDLERAKSILNIGKSTAEKCKDCWCYRQCLVCVKAMDGLDRLNSAQFSGTCQDSRATAESKMKDFCVLEDLGYDFFEEKTARSKLRGDFWYE